MKASVIMEIVSYVTKFLFILLFVAVAMYFFEIQNVNNFRQTVTHHIERHGGLTVEALDHLEVHANRYFNGRFEVTTPAMPAQPFGTRVDYEVRATIRILFFPMPEQISTFRGSAVSQIR